MTLEAEVRNGLRDEFAIKNNRFNTLMVCDTVMLGCAFSVLSDGALPAGSHVAVVWVFMSGLSICIMCLTVSLWCSFIVCRRLNEITAWGFMERQSIQRQVSHWEDEMNAHKLQRKFDDWFKQHCFRMSANAETALTGGVLSLFVAASALLYARTVYEYDIANGASSWLFVACAGFTALFIVILERRETKMKKSKEGVYKKQTTKGGRSMAATAMKDLLERTDSVRPPKKRLLHRKSKFHPIKLFSRLE